MDIKIAYSLDLDVWNYLRSVFEFAWLKHGRNNIQAKLFQSLSEDFLKALKETKNENQARKGGLWFLRKFLLKGSFR